MRRQGLQFNTAIRGAVLSFHRFGLAEAVDEIAVDRCECPDELVHRYVYRSPLNLGGMRLGRLQSGREILPHQGFTHWLVGLARSWAIWRKAFRVENMPCGYGVPASRAISCERGDIQLELGTDFNHEKRLGGRS
jgi:hypothetical protein